MYLANIRCSLLDYESMTCEHIITAPADTNGQMALILIGWLI